MLSKLFAKEEMPEATPYVFEYDRPVPNFNEFTQNLINHRYDTKRHSTTDEFAPQTSKRGRAVKGTN